MALPAQHHLAAALQAAWPHGADDIPLRPLRVFAPPEPIDAIAAEVPDKPPRRFVWRRVAHRVVQAEGPERIAMEWWRMPAQMQTRDYFRVEAEDGQRFWLYRDGLYGEVDMPQWYVHGVFA